MCAFNHNPHINEQKLTVEKQQKFKQKKFLFHFTSDVVEQQGAFVNVELIATNVEEAIKYRHLRLPQQLNNIFAFP